MPKSSVKIKYKFQTSVFRNDSNVVSGLHFKLTALVETSNIDLLVHPVILSLIEIKWKKFGRYLQTNVAFF